MNDYADLLTVVHSAGIPPAAYMNKEFVLLRNTAVFKSVGQYIAKKSRRPVSAVAGQALSYSLNQTTLWGGVSGSKKYAVPLERATQEEAAAAVRTTSGTSTKFPTTTFDTSASAASAKVARRRSTAMSVSMKAKAQEVANAVLNTAPGNSLSMDDSGAAAVLSKLAFEKFLLRLEVVVQYNTWLTVDQVVHVYYRFVDNAASSHARLCVGAHHFASPPFPHRPCECDRARAVHLVQLHRGPPSVLLPAPQWLRPAA
jgi:hypothetical protein